MYTTCLFCTRPLGANETLERFPVGHRLAFDPEKGRLWVVCRHCERWNLTPFEERWEAIEQAERLYRDTRLRVSTDNIGLARLPEGLELVRIGRPQRPEIAAWRYGDQFGRRRLKRVITGGAITVAGAVAFVGGLSYGIVGLLALNLGERGLIEIRQHLASRPIASLRDEGGELLQVRRRHLTETRITAGEGGALALDVQHTAGRTTITGEAARRAAIVLFPAANRSGGTKADVQLAVARLVHAGDAESYLRRIAARGDRLTRVTQRDAGPAEDPDQSGSGLLALSISARLAIEMALHEEQERRALEGELAELENAWREAEEIGAIADSLLLPSWIDDAIRRLK